MLCISCLQLSIFQHFCDYLYGVVWQSSRSHGSETWGGWSGQCRLHVCIDWGGHGRVLCCGRTKNKGTKLFEVENPHMTWLWYRSLINQLTMRIHPSYVIFWSSGMGTLWWCTLPSNQVNLPANTLWNIILYLQSGLDALRIGYNGQLDWTQEPSTVQWIKTTCFWGGICCISWLSMWYQSRRVQM